MELLGPIQNVARSIRAGAEGLSTIYDTVSGRLTALRAGMLDNLANIAAGPVAQQSILGAPTDAINLAAAVPNSNLIKDIDAIYQLLKGHAGGTSHSTLACDYATLSSANPEMAFLILPTPLGCLANHTYLAQSNATFAYRQGSGSFHHARLQAGYQQGDSSVWGRDLFYGVPEGVVRSAYTLPSVTEPGYGPGATVYVPLGNLLAFLSIDVFFRLTSYRADNSVIGYQDYVWTLIPSVANWTPPVPAVTTLGTATTTPPSVIMGTTETFTWTPMPGALGYRIDVDFNGTTLSGTSGALNFGAANYTPPPTSYTFTVPTAHPGDPSHGTVPVRAQLVAFYSTNGAPAIFQGSPVNGTVVRSDVSTSIYLMPA